ncbi:MAG: hypothetical protein HN849_14490 [Victivallales bacterium]|jgi:hypothetical protein|nr:hypothetical protein [Victivallales bacterium]MBT7300724.1 hypothetical protein [Victivallales bacterium]
MKMAPLVALLILAGSPPGLCGEGVRIICAESFETGEKFTGRDLGYRTQAVLNGERVAPLFSILGWESGSRKKLPLRLDETRAYPGNGSKSLTFGPSAQREIVIYFDGCRKPGEKGLKSAPGLHVAFCVFPGIGSGGYTLSCWNLSETEPMRRWKKYPLKLVHGEWNVVHLKLHGPSRYKTGDVLGGVNLNNAGSGGRQFWIDGFVLWEGRDTVPPTSPGDISARQNKGSALVRWAAAEDDILVKTYRVYRGTVPDFPANGKTLVGETNRLYLSDTSLMREDGNYYKVRAVDVSGNLSPPPARGCRAK